MGRLAGFRYREIARRMAALGFRFERHAKSSHEVWRDPSTGRIAVLVQHPGDMPEGTLRGLLRHAGISVDDFLAA
jgi:predicted RNA binding protein YcfA (HicA-like mRNA interferase family)